MASEMVERATLAFMKALPSDFYADTMSGPKGPWWENFVIDGSGDIRPAIQAALDAALEDAG